MSSKARDILLLIVAAGLVAAALVPTGEDEGSEQADAPAAPIDAPEEPVEDMADDGADRGIAGPITDRSHLFWPLLDGSVWVYRVESPDDLVRAKTWTLELVSAPDGENPGLARAGFDDSREERAFWVEGGSIRTDCLPLTEPLIFEGDRPIEASGAYLPSPGGMIEGAVWNQYLLRDVEYRSTDREGKTHLDQVRAKQSDRATVWGPDRILLKAGYFDAVRIDWLGRIDMKAGDRAVLAALTAEPYREERTWFAKGVGMIRRKVVLGDDKSVTFDLIEYRRPDPEGRAAEHKKE